MVFEGISERDPDVPRPVFHVSGNAAERPVLRLDLPAELRAHHIQTRVGTAILTGKFRQEWVPLIRLNGDRLRLSWRCRGFGLCGLRHGQFPVYLWSPGKAVAGV